MDSLPEGKVVATLGRLVGLRCWYVNAGGAAGSSFSLAFGARKKRRRPLKNPNVSDEFRVHEGEANLLVWCSWRLDGKNDAVASSDQSAEQILSTLESIVGQYVRKVEVLSRAHDFKLSFDDFVLTVFCDHVPVDPSFDGNWQLSLEGTLTSVGPGFKIDVGPDDE